MNEYVLLIYLRPDGAHLGFASMLGYRRFRVPAALASRGTLAGARLPVDAGALPQQCGGVAGFYC